MRASFRVGKVDVIPVTSREKAAHTATVTAMTEAARMDTRPYVPNLSGALAMTGDLESRPAAGQLVYGNSSVPYAKAQYYGLPNKTVTRSPLATMHWFEYAKAACKEAWRQVGARVYAHQIGGKA